MTGYDHAASRPRKLEAISHCIDAGFEISALGGLYEKGVVYYTLGGETFNDVRMFYNVFGEKIHAAISYENLNYQACKAAGNALQDSGAINDLRLHVLNGDILSASLKYQPRDTLGLILFLDLTQFLSFGHQEYFQRWAVDKSVVPGDVLLITSSLPPWELVRQTFVERLAPVLRDMGASERQIESKEYWKESYVRCLIKYFADDWAYQQISGTSFRHFFTRLYRDTRIEMVLNGFVVH
jgi:hypothetical protein